MAVDGQTLILAEDTSIGERLRLARIAAGLEQAQMAIAAGISVRSYQRTETGEREATRLELVEWARMTEQSLALFSSAAVEERTVNPSRQAVKQTASVVP